MSQVKPPVEWEVYVYENYIIEKGDGFHCLHTIDKTYGVDVPERIPGIDERRDWKMAALVLLVGVSIAASFLAVTR